MYGLNSEFQERDVAIYARVSTEHEAQLSALENQLEWYKPILAARPNWTLKAQYIDEGITGTSALKRPRFMQMISDAKEKKFNMIITREVSRFARNTVDTLQYTRLLKEYGVEVYFINDNIKTFDGDGELRLTIMATLAQDESRKTSIRVKSGQQTSMKNGVVYGTGNILGYDRVGREFVINKEQAETVRMIFDMYLSGMGVTKIQHELEKRGRLTATGKTSWFASYISHMLKNTFYCGIMTYHKEYTPDYLKQKRIKNHGEMELVRVKGTHTPIVTEEEFEQVQRMLARHSHKVLDKNGKSHTVGVREHATAYGRLLICKCGKRFNARSHSRADRSDGADYQCYSSINQGSKRSREKLGLTTEGYCDSPFVQSWKLDMMVERIFDRYIENINELMEVSYSMLEKHIADEEEIPDNSEEIEYKKRKCEQLRRKEENLIEMRVEGDIDKDLFKEKKEQIEAQVVQLEDEIASLTPRVVRRTACDYKEKLAMLKEHLEKYTGCEHVVIPESVVEAFISKIWVSKEEYRWYLRTGKEDDDEFNIDDHILIGRFTLTIDDAKKYVYSFSTRRRVYKWQDLHVSVWI